MLPQLALLAAIVVGVSFAGLVRRRDPGQRGYVFVVAAVLMLNLAALVQADRFLSVVAISLVVLVVVLPWVLDVLVRICFSRDRLALAVRLAGWRVMLMPGAGLSRQQGILHGLAVLERGGVDDALSYFRGRVHEAEDETELRVLHEQIVSMLLYGQRWTEGIAHYEARFPPGYAAQRPPLALGLLRAYGEAGKLERAAGLLRSIEERLGHDPRAAGVVSQARLTFLAYAGVTQTVDAALTEERRRRLGLSAASGALFRGIALSRAGCPDEAQSELARVEGLAKARDGRVVMASRQAIDELPGETTELPDELSQYAGKVAERLEGFLTATPTLRRMGPLRVTPMLLAALVLGHLALLALDGGGPGLLRMGGASAQLVGAGSWGRIVTGLLTQTDPIGLLLAAYGIWLGAPLVERLYGAGRLLVVSLGAGAAGLAVAALTAPDPIAVLDGTSVLATGVVMAALWVVLLPRTNLPGRTRRVLALPLVLVLVGIGISVPRELGLLLNPAGLVVAAAIGIAAIGLAPPRGRRAGGLRGLAVVLAIGALGSVGMVAVEDARAQVRQPQREVKLDGLVLTVPSQLAPQPEEGADDERPWPRMRGLYDALAQRAGDRVQVLVAPAPAEDAPSALLRLDPDLSHEYDEADVPAPAEWTEVYERAAGEDAADALRTTIMRRNGQDVAVVIERTMGTGPDAPVLVLYAAPPQALGHAPVLYADVLAHARPATAP
ncbi:MAG: hypothetical protein AAF799_39590 [Myxococcota bacterium]